RGVTAPGIPVIAAGHNGHLAWGVTSGLDDDDDLYIERLAGKERYRFKGRTRKMSCRNETIAVAGAKSVKQRFCRTVHGPVQLRGSKVAYSRRYAIWGHELGTLRGLAAVDEASSVAQVNSAMKLVTWDENLLAADDAGHIGWWHPGRLPLRPKRWDERLPLPGTGEAEWRGVLPFKALPKVIDPPQGWIANWNNMPSAGWTNGDNPAQERNAYGLSRAAYLFQVVAKAEAAPSYDALKGVERQVGVTAQQRPLLDARLRAAQAIATGPARTVLDTIVAWDGNYDRTDANGTIDPGVAAYEALKTAAKTRVLSKAAIAWLGERGSSHPYDFGGSDAAAWRTLDAKGIVAAAASAASALQQRFGSSDAATWRDPRKLYDVQVQGVADKPTIKFYDRGTWAQAVELGP
ncbi:MAG: penicillin amidase, partial [Solirubrobacteraceae bacterium]|nr:penicillin amidase [Solirubrobacteraceae bacterium]